MIKKWYNRRMMGQVIPKIQLGTKQLEEEEKVRSSYNRRGKPQRRGLRKLQSKSLGKNYIYIYIEREREREREPKGMFFKFKFPYYVYGTSGKLFPSIKKFDLFIIYFNMLLNPPIVD